MYNTNYLPVRRLIAYERSQEGESLQGFAAHNALYKKMRNETRETFRPPKLNLCMPSKPRLVAVVSDVMDLLIDKLILDDLKEQRHLDCRVTEEAEARKRTEQ